MGGPMARGEPGQIMDGGIAAKSRIEALALGVRRYNTGKPCIRGHHADRFTRGGKCTMCNRDTWQRTVGPEGSTEINRKKLRERMRFLRRAKSKAARIARLKALKATRGGAQNLRIDRFPAWLLAERDAIESLYRYGDDLRPDYHYPSIPTRGAIVGIHTLANLDLETAPANGRKRKYPPAGDPAEFVARGMAIWTRDVDASGKVNWQNYVGDKLAEFYGAAFMFFDTFTARQLFAAKLPFASEAKTVGSLSLWLSRISGLQSGAFTLVSAGELPRGRKVWRIDACWQCAADRASDTSQNGGDWHIGLDMDDRKDHWNGNVPNATRLRGLQRRCTARP